VTVRRNRRTVLSGPEALAEAASQHFSDLRPYLAEGVEGLRRYTHELTRWLEVKGSNAEALPDVLHALGVDVATCYRVMLSQPSGRPLFKINRLERRHNSYVG
jgi:hypothetical protein